MKKLYLNIHLMSFVFNVYLYIHVFGHTLYLTLYLHFHVVLDWTLNLERFEFELSSSQVKELGGLWTASELWRQMI